MESNKLNKKLSSIFWYVLYSLPLLVLFISLLGNYNIFKFKGDLLSQDYSTSYSDFVELEYRSFNDLYSTTGDFVFYFNNTLSNEEIFTYFSNSNDLSFWDVSSYIGLPFELCDLFSFEYTFIEDGYTSSYTTCSLELIRYNSSDYILCFKYSDNRIFIWSSVELDTPFGYISEGWNNNFNDFIYSYTPSFSTCCEFETEYSSYLDYISPVISYAPYYEYVTFNGTNSLNFVIPQTIDGNTYYMSFFDVSLYNTFNTFDKFTLPFLNNAFSGLFNLLGFETGFLNSFVNITFTWMLQLMLLHVVVDTFAFVFKIYHKLMEKVV